MGYQTMGYQTMGYQTMGYQTMGYQTMGYPTGPSDFVSRFSVRISPPTPRQQAR
jgi:hypothetical protein